MQLTNKRFYFTIVTSALPSLVITSDPSKFLGINVAYSVEVDSQEVADRGKAALSTVGIDRILLGELIKLNTNTPGGGFAGETQLTYFLPLTEQVLLRTVFGAYDVNTCIFVCRR